MFKFSGLVITTGGADPVPVWFADAGSDLGLTPFVTQRHPYPIAKPSVILSAMAVTLLTAIPSAFNIVFELFRNGILVPGGTLTATGPQPAQTTLPPVNFPPIVYSAGSVYELRATPSAAINASNTAISAVVS
jgi:hypothetical protein